MKAPSLDAPLSAADYTKIQQHRAELARIRLAIDKACAAGIQTDEHKLICEDLQSKYDLLLKTYFPQGMPGD